MIADYTGYITDIVGLAITDPTYTVDKVYVNGREIKLAVDYWVEIVEISGIDYATLYIDRDVFVSVGEYDVEIEGTTDETATVTLNLASWEMLVLYDLADLQSVEPELLQDDTDDILAQVKNELEIDLWDRLGHLLKTGKVDVGDDFNLLDYIKNPIKLKYIAIHRALSIIFNSRRYDNSGTGLMDRKFKEHNDNYLRQLRTIPQILQFDLTYDRPIGRVRFSR